MRTPERDSLRCSFCNKAQDEVRKLMAGPEAFICNECVGICVDSFASDSTAEGKVWEQGESRRLRVKAAAIFPDRSANCSLCGEPGLPEEMLPIEGRGMLCGECADAVEEALSRGRPIT